MRLVLSIMALAVVCGGFTACHKSSDSKDGMKQEKMAPKKS